MQGKTDANRPGGHRRSIGHPVSTASGSQEWYYAGGRTRAHRSAARYFTEGRRSANFPGEKVVKYHRTLTSLLQGLTDAGFRIREVRKPLPTAEMPAAAKDAVPLFGVLYFTG